MLSMKKLLLIFLLGITALYSYAQDVPVCEAYPDFKPQCVQKSTDVWVYYYIFFAETMFTTQAACY